MKVIALTMAVLAALAVGVSIALAADYTPEQLKAMAYAGSHHATSVKGVEVPASEAYAAGAEWAGQPGVSTEGAVSTAAPGSPLDLCWQQNWHMVDEWGNWPVEQTVYENRYWCTNYLGGYQTYRTSHVYLSGTWCDSSNAYASRESGGNGYTWTTVRSGGHFSCPSGAWWHYNFDNWQEWACNTWGYCAFVRDGRL